MVRSSSSEATPSLIRGEADLAIIATACVITTGAELFPPGTYNPSHFAEVTKKHMHIPDQLKWR
jgi:hypothetical protein